MHKNTPANNKYKKGLKSNELKNLQAYVPEYIQPDLLKFCQLIRDNWRDNWKKDKELVLFLRKYVKDNK